MWLHLQRLLPSPATSVPSISEKVEYLQSQMGSGFYSCASLRSKNRGDQAGSRDERTHLQWLAQVKLQLPVRCHRHAQWPLPGKRPGRLQTPPGRKPGTRQMRSTRLCLHISGWHAVTVPGQTHHKPGLLTWSCQVVPSTLLKLAAAQ